MLRRPAELSIQLGEIDCVTEVMPWTVGNEGDQFAMGATVRRLDQLVQRVADGVHNIDVSTLGITTDVVGLADPASLEHQGQRLRMILDEKPITNIESAAVDRHR